MVRGAKWGNGGKTLARGAQLKSSDKSSGAEGAVYCEALAANVGSFSSCHWACVYIEECRVDNRCGHSADAANTRKLVEQLDEVQRCTDLNLHDHVERADSLCAASHYLG